MDNNTLCCHFVHNNLARSYVRFNAISLASILVLTESEANGGYCLLLILLSHMETCQSDRRALCYKDSYT